MGLVCRVHFLFLRNLGRRGQSLQAGFKPLAYPLRSFCCAAVAAAAADARRWRRQGAVIHLKVSFAQAFLGSPAPPARPGDFGCFVRFSFLRRAGGGDLQRAAGGTECSDDPVAPARLRSGRLPGETAAARGCKTECGSEARRQRVSSASSSPVLSHGRLQRVLPSGLSSAQPGPGPAERGPPGVQHPPLPLLPGREAASRRPARVCRSNPSPPWAAQPVRIWQRKPPWPRRRP